MDPVYSLARYNEEAFEIVAGTADTVSKRVSELLAQGWVRDQDPYLLGNDGGEMQYCQYMRKLKTNVQPSDS